MLSTTRVHSILGILFACLLCFVTVGCPDKTAGESLDEAIEEVQDETGDAVEAVKDEVDDATN